MNRREVLKLAAAGIVSGVAGRFALASRRERVQPGVTIADLKRYQQRVNQDEWAPADVQFWVQEFSSPPMAEMFRFHSVMLEIPDPREAMLCVSPRFVQRDERWRAVLQFVRCAKTIPICDGRTGRRIGDFQLYRIDGAFSDLKRLGWHRVSYAEALAWL